MIIGKKGVGTAVAGRGGFWLEFRASRIGVQGKDFEVSTYV